MKRLIKVAENKDVRIPEMYLVKIENAIGAAIDPSEENQFSGFEEIDDLTKTRAREIYNKVDEIRAIFYLKYVLKKGIDQSQIFSFLFDVIIGGKDQEAWVREKFGSHD
jgi:hypothetical protein